MYGICTVGIFKRKFFVLITTCTYTLATPHNMAANSFKEEVM